MSPRSRPPARRRRYCHHTAVLGTRRTRCGSHAACTSHTASASPVLAVASNSIPTYLQKGLRERVNKKSLLRRRCQFCYRGSHPGRHHGSRNLCRLTRPVPWQLRRASADGSCRTERPPRAPAGHPRAERRPRGAVPVVAACANVGSGSSGVARRDERFEIGHKPAPALAAGPFVPSGGVVRAGHAAAAWLHAVHWYGGAPGAPSR